MVRNEKGKGEKIMKGKGRKIKREGKGEDEN